MQHHAENDMKPEVTMVDTKRKKKIPVLCYRCPGAKYTVLYSHGNATDVGAMHDRFVQLVTALNVNVVAYDYTGYGASTGDVPTEKDTYCDIEAAYQWTLKNCPGNGVNEADGTTSGENIVLYGQSLGSGPTCYLACKERVAGVVLHSPILSAMRVITDSRILAFIDMYPNIERIGKVTSPVVVIHGMLDAEVNWEHGRRLHELTPSIYRRNPWWVSDRGHNDLINDAEHLEEYIWHMKMFLADLDIKSE